MGSIPTNGYWHKAGRAACKMDWNPANLLVVAFLWTWMELVLEYEKTNRKESWKPRLSQNILCECSPHQNIFYFYIFCCYLSERTPILDLVVHPWDKFYRVELIHVLFIMWVLITCAQVFVLKFKLQLQYNRPLVQLEAEICTVYCVQFINVISLRQSSCPDTVIMHFSCRDRIRYWKSRTEYGWFYL